jgi:hypothetical protein
MSYQKLKELAIETIDDFSDLDIAAEYGTNYSAKTKLNSIFITEPVRSIMPPRVNKVFFAEYQGKWKGVRAIDTLKCESISDFIKLVAKNSGETVPDGEPK